MSATDFDLILAVRTALLADPVVSGFIGTRFYDPPPSGQVAQSPYISLGPTSINPDDADCIPGDEITFQLDVWTWGAGEAHSSVQCRKICSAVGRLLHRAELPLNTNALASLELVLTRIMRDPDNVTNHGVMQFTAVVEIAD